MYETQKTPDELFSYMGRTIRGKWNKKVYTFKQKLGAGAIGTVYLCETAGKQVALKMSDKKASITMEVNVLKALQQAQEKHLGPDLLDVDDWTSPHGQIFSFYVMEYVQGESLERFMKRKDSEWLGILMLQLLNDLEKLHQTGWVFGDLKMDNLLVAHSPPKIRWVDVGGMTKMGRSIKEYTEFFDRGYWELGSRRAEASYDLFSFTLVLLSLYYPNHFHKQGNPKQQLFKKIDAAQSLKPYRHCLKKAISGQYSTSANMKEELSAVIFKQQKEKQKVGESPSLVIESVGLFLMATMYYLMSLFLF